MGRSPPAYCGLVPWLRSGDNAATHPIVMRVVSLVRRVKKTVLVDEKDVAVNEVFGFVTRCALESAGHTTDYVIGEGTALTMGGPRTDRLLELAVKAGYLTKAKDAHGLPIWLLVDEPEFLHMRRKDEIDRERQRKADNANTAIVAPVRRRDGDECRYCGVPVNWNDRKSARGATYDHREPGKPATIATLVVACQQCNGGRGDDPHADDRYPLRPAPHDPYYSPRTVTFLASHGFDVTDDQRPGSQPASAPGEPATSGSTPLPPVGRAPVTQLSTRTGQAHGPPRSADPADNQHPGSGRGGSGRDGSVGLVLGDPAGTRALPTRRRKRSPRGRNRTGDQG